MISFVDRIIDRTTMYRVILYHLILILVGALLLGAAGTLPYSPLSIIASTLFLLAACLVTNRIFSHVHEAPVNLESPYITALILTCIFPPVRSLHDLPVLFWAAVLSMASKYILAIRGKHLFNPVAVAAVLTGLWLNQPPIWWVGTPSMLPLVLFGGLAITRKMRRYAQTFSFFGVAIMAIAGSTLLAGHDPLAAVSHSLLSSSLLFFGFYMVTEPLTSPPTATLQGLFGGLVGLLFAPQVHIGSLYSTPEIALAVGNLFAYLASPKIRQRLTLLRSERIASNTLELELQPERPFRYLPGQYMEFTLPHPKTDLRGTRRYFTLASSPTEETLRLGVRLSSPGSSFKTGLTKLAPGDTLMAGQIAGDFTLPAEPSRKLGMIAGGIGITPFRSMLKYVADTGQERDIALFYMNRTAEEIAYLPLFNELQGRNGIRIIHTLTDTVPEGWTGRQGRVDAEMIRTETPDFVERDWFVSGPHLMVTSMEAALRQLGVPSRQVHKDFFPGL